MQFQDVPLIGNMAHGAVVLLLQTGVHMVVLAVVPIRAAQVRRQDIGHVKTQQELELERQHV